MCRPLCSLQRKLCGGLCVPSLSSAFIPSLSLLGIYLASSLDFPPGTGRGVLQGLRLLDVTVNAFVSSPAKHLLLRSCLGGGQGTCIPPCPAEELV